MQSYLDIIQSDFKKVKITIFRRTRLTLNLVPTIRNKKPAYNCNNTGKSIMTENKMIANAV